MFCTGDRLTYKDGHNLILKKDFICGWCWILAASNIPSTHRYRGKNVNRKYTLFIPHCFSVLQSQASLWTLSYTLDEFLSWSRPALDILQGNSIISPFFWLDFRQCTNRLCSRVMPFAFDHASQMKEVLAAKRAICPAPLHWSLPRSYTWGISWLLRIDWTELGHICESPSAGEQVPEVLFVFTSVDS